MNERKFFGDTSFRLNADDAPFAVALNEVVNFENVRTQTTDTGKTSTVESVGGNVLLSSVPVFKTYITIGSVDDIQNGRFIKFIKNTNGISDQIICFYKSSGIEYLVLSNEDVVGGLNFSLQSPIHSAVIVNGYLYWTDGTNNQPRKVNIEAGIKAYYASFVTTQVPYVLPVNFSEITLIKPPPIYAPIIVKALAAVDINLIANSSFEFAFQYVFWDNETTVPGVYSVASRLNYDIAYDPIGLNVIGIAMAAAEFIPNSVRIVNLICRVQDGSPEGGNNANIIYSWDKLIPAQAAQIAQQNAASAQLEYAFYNTVTGEALSPDDVLRIADTVPLFSETVEYANNRLFLGNNIDGGQTPPTTSLSITQNSSTITFGTSPFYTPVFLADSAYITGVQFYDFAMRPIGGVITNPTLMVSIPQVVNPLSLSFTAVTSLTWNLSNGSALTEIPSNAYYYSPVRTLNQRTRLLIESVSVNPRYATLDSSGNYVFTTTTYGTGVVALALDTASLNKAKLGYVFNQGDQAMLWNLTGTPTVYNVSVIGQFGGYILVSALTSTGGFGNISSQVFQFQVYTPYQTNTSEPYFQVGQVYAVTNPTQNSRVYSTLTGTFAPDTYRLQRTAITGASSIIYYAATTSPNDSFYKRWDGDGGKLSIVTNLGQSDKITYIAISDTFIPNTAVNGLSTFRALNESNVPQNCGAIMKLLLISKIENAQGSIMLAICAGGETCSLYLGEVQITDNTGATQFFSSNSSIIGTINLLKGSKGTINPESVSAYRGEAWWFDANNGEWVQYSNNGLDVISIHKMQRFWSVWANKYLSMTYDQIAAFGNRPFVYSCVDTKHKELLISIPKLSNTPPSGYLPDYTNTIYPFDILDFQAKTIVYKLGVAERLPHWQGAYTFYAENFIALQNNLYSFSGGLTYLHNQPNYGNFYGVQYKSRIMCVSNKFPQVPKCYNNISISSNLNPSLVYMYCLYPIQQSSDLVDFNFTNNGNNPLGLEGIWYSTIRRNKLVPNAYGYTTDGLLTGEKMRNTNMFLLFEFNVSNVPLELKFITIGFEASEGHQNQIDK